MVIYNNMAAMSALSESKRQNNKMSAAMEKLASGLKVRNAGDDAAAYSISEKMRVQIRALNQCSANTNKGADITNVAEGAMQSQVELLTTIRELALKSANGVYSDSDRGIMQKEVNQRLTEIDDIAVSTNYNGRHLLNQVELDHTDTTFIPGSATFDTEAAEKLNKIGLVPEPHTRPAIKDGILCHMPSMSYKELQAGQMVYDPDNSVYKPLTAMPVINDIVYDAGGGSYRVVMADVDGSGNLVPAIEYPTGSYVKLDINSGSSLPVAGNACMPYSKHFRELGTVGGTASLTAGVTRIVLADAYSATPKTYIYDTLPDGKPAATCTDRSGGYHKQMYSIDFSSLGNLPSALDKQGFSVLCDGCKQFVSVMFDAEMAAGTGEYHVGTDSWSGCYVVGVQGAYTPSDVVRAMSDGLNVAVGSAIGNTPVALTSERFHSVKLNTYTDAAGNMQCYIEKSGNALYMYNGIKGSLNVIPDQYFYANYIKPGSSIYIQGDTAASANTVLKLPNTTLGMLFPGTDDHWAGIEPTDADYPEPWPNEYDGLTDDEKKQKFRKEVWPYPEVTDIDLGSCIGTQQKARDFLTNIDQALRYLENSITTMGAQHQRLNVMNDNILVSHENTTAADSTIRDADMAKEMTAYAKYSLLSQSSQAMLAQANQSSSNVLNLLQS